MKNVLLLSFFLVTKLGLSQENDNSQKQEDYDLFISAGCHIGLWNLTGNKNLTLETTPYNIHIDKVFNKKNAFGLGYSHDRFEFGPVDFFSINPGILRQNIRFRYYKFLIDYNKPFSIYLGASAGVSIWASQYDSKKTYWPSAQFIFGMKVKITETFFWQTEFGAGPPYAFQTSLGIKF